MKPLWDLNAFVSSYWGMYVVQSVLHSVIALTLVESAFLAWNLKEPRAKQRFRFLVILLPVVSYPVYQLLSPRRGDVYFRLDTLFDSNRWLFFEVWEGLPLMVFFGGVLGITSLVFFVQEVLPMLMHTLERTRSSGEEPEEAEDPAHLRKVSEALADLPFDEEAVTILDDEDLVLFSSTGLRPRIFVSTGLLGAFDTEHLQVAFAHEIGHIQRSRRPLLIFAYLFRVAMFFSPLAMIEFRRLAQEEEMVCDDIAVGLTGKPERLVEAIEMLRPTPEDYDTAEGGQSVRAMASSLEQYSQDVLLKSRILSIEQAERAETPWGIPYGVTLVLIIGINYFVV
jgi:Zn-dependent protease with chaperone function